MSNSPNDLPNIESVDEFPVTEGSANITQDHFMTIVNENYGRYIKKSYGYLKDKSLAEDAVQEGILIAYKLSLIHI